jgi:hypothetical protein
MQAYPICIEAPEIVRNTELLCSSVILQTGKKWIASKAQKRSFRVRLLRAGEAKKIQRHGNSIGGSYGCGSR